MLPFGQVLGMSFYSQFIIFTANAETSENGIEHLAALGGIDVNGRIRLLHLPRKWLYRLGLAATVFFKLFLV